MAGRVRTANSIASHGASHDSLFSGDALNEFVTWPKASVTKTKSE
jgi:hypothetical protein